MALIDPHDEDFDRDFIDDELEEEFDCHMMRDGSCGAAGSEDCEFKCPYRRDQRERELRRREARVKPMPLFEDTRP